MTLPLLTTRFELADFWVRLSELFEHASSICLGSELLVLIQSSFCCLDGGRPPSSSLLHTTWWDFSL